MSKAGLTRLCIKLEEAVITEAVIEGMNSSNRRSSLPTGGGEIPNSSEETTAEVSSAHLYIGDPIPKVMASASLPPSKSHGISLVALTRKCWAQRILGNVVLELRWAW